MSDWLRYPAISPKLWERTVLFLGFLVLISSRMPHVLRGRFWAEDGHFFLDALNRPFFEALTTPHSGYVNLVASIAAQAARLMPLEFAPVASCAVALAVQSLPALLLVTSRIPWLQGRVQMALALLLMATPPLTEEVWINPITSQYHLMLCTGLILADETRKGVVRVLHFGILALAPLAGPGNAFLIPLYALRAWRDRSWARGWQALTLSAGTVIQLAVLLTHPEPNREPGMEPTLLLAVTYVKHLLVPFLGRHQVQDVSGFLPSLYAAGRLPVFPTIMVLVAIAAFIFALRRCNNRESWWLAAGGFLMMALSYAGAYGGQANLLVAYYGMRYAFAPQLLFELALLGIVTTTSGQTHRTAALILLWLTFVGVHEFYWVSPEMAHGPSWRAQILAREADPGAPIKLWPPNWSIRLPPGT